jgi:hypothetical protein
VRESQLWEFRDSHLGVSRQNAIWMLVLWPAAKYTIKGKVVAPPKSKLWRVLWVRVCPWLILAPKVLQLCINQLVVWFVQVRVSDWSLVILPSPISKLQHASLTPQSVVSQRMCLNFLLFRYFHFKLTFEPIKEFRSTSSRLLGGIYGCWEGVQ